MTVAPPIILTTHYFKEAENLCKHIGIIHHGELIENSSMKHLLQKLHVETFILNLAKPVETAPGTGFSTLCLSLRR